MPRAFRSDESILAETLTRGFIPTFLSSVGCTGINDLRKQTGSAISQTIEATLPNQTKIRAKVKLCWRRSGRAAHKVSYSATQLIAKVDPGTGEIRVRAFAQNAIHQGVDHLLVIQGDGQTVEMAALIPLSGLGDIWASQRDTSATIISAGKLGRRNKNHAENGHSPTLYLQDDAAPEVAAALWSYPGVINLKGNQFLATVGIVDLRTSDDTFQDLLIVSYDGFGSDAPEMMTGSLSYVKRDDKVRRAVIKRSGGKCERLSCGASRPYKGFLDVHHILGIEASDRVWNCVALCPNCHREAHISPGSKSLNEQLLAFASRSK